MKKSYIALGLLITLMPYEIGIPEEWKKVFYVIAGLLIIVLAVVPRKETAVSAKLRAEPSFVENSPGH